jgi:glycosyltransferase involved in cell wall biosynthesis
MKILYVCNEYPPEPHGGLGVFLKNLAEGLVQKKHEVFVFGYYERLNKSVIENIKGVNIIKFPLPYKEKDFLSLIRLRNSYAADIKKLVNSKGIDIVEFHDTGAYFLFMKAPFCVRLHNSERYTRKKRGMLLNIFERIAFVFRQTTFIAVSDFHLKSFKNYIKFIHPLSKLVVIKNGIIVGNNKLPINNNKKIVYGGTLKDVKGVDILINAFIDGGFSNEGFTLDIFGPNTYKDNFSYWSHLINTIKKMKQYIESGYIKYHGPKEQDLLHRAFKEAYICVFPSRYESFGLVVIEAMSLGGLVIYSNQGAASEIISDGFDGFLFKNNDCDDLINKIKKVSGMSLDKKNYIRENALKKSKLFSFEHNINKSLNLYENILKNY